MTTQIAVKLPDSLLASVDELVKHGVVESRSDAVRVGLGLLRQAADRQRIDEAFRSGFSRHPEGDDELADARRLAAEAIEDEPWEPWW